MSVLLMAPRGAARSGWYRKVFAGIDLVSAGPVADCKAIVVINDHSAEVVGLLQTALHLSARHAELPVAMLTAIDRLDIEALIRLLDAPRPSACIPIGQVLAAIVTDQMPVQVRLDPQAINFEYDA